MYNLQQDEIELVIDALRDSIDKMKTIKVVDCEDPLVVWNMLQASENLITNLTPLVNRIYHTLLRMDKDNRWCAEFGDYEIEVVQAELDDNMGDHYQKNHLIITTTHDQPAIDTEIARLNRELKRIEDDIPF